jgi:hypothetical protein
MSPPAVTVMVFADRSGVGVALDRVDVDVGSGDGFGLHAEQQVAAACAVGIGLVAQANGELRARHGGVVTGVEIAFRLQRTREHRELHLIHIGRRQRAGAAHRRQSAATRWLRATPVSAADD